MPGLRRRQTQAGWLRGGAPSSLTAYQAKALAEPMNASGLTSPLSPGERRALLLAHPAVATLVSAATRAPFCTAACLAAAPTSPATRVTPMAPAEVTTATVKATPLGCHNFYFLTLGTPRGEEAERGGHKSRARELYRRTPRDSAAFKTPGKVV